MNQMGVAILAIFSYLLGMGSQALQLGRFCKRCKTGLIIFGLIALVLHGYLLYQWIDGLQYALEPIERGQNLYSLNVLSFILWLASFLIMFTMLRKPVANLAFFTFTGAAISIVLVMYFPGVYIVDTSFDPQHLIHILLSLLAFSVLSIAVAQALLLAFQDVLLRHKYASGILGLLPPLETMENMLFESITIAFILLSLVLFSSMIFYYGFAPIAMSHSPYVAFLGWGVFAILLIGRFYLGWRGRTAIRWTLYGVGLLLLSYFGGWFLLELQSVRNFFG